MTDKKTRKDIEKRVINWFGEPVLVVEDELEALISAAEQRAYDKALACVDALNADYYKRYAAPLSIDVINDVRAAIQNLKKEGKP